ncbi:hypothetical protein [Trinickia sp. YCB016]
MDMIDDVGCTDSGLAAQDERSGSSIIPPSARLRKSFARSGLDSQRELTALHGTGKKNARGLRHERRKPRARCRD